MSVEPPSSGPPPGEPRRPWWRSAPRIALATTTAVAVTAVALLLTRSGDSGKDTGASGGEVFLQAAARPGPDPFTESTAVHGTAPPATTPSQAPDGALRSVDGGSVGLYGGSRDVAACDVGKQIRVLTAAPAKNAAFASVAGVQPSQVPSYLRSLTPVQLRADTRVTNHGFRDGAATSYQSVLQAGTAVLVDGYGVPRVRCACGNPLGRPLAQSGAPRATGDAWPGYRPANVIVVAPSITVVNVFVLYDHDDHGWIARPRGDSGHGDRPTTPPPSPSPSPTPTPTPSPSPSPSASPSSSATPTPSPPPSPSTSPSSSSGDSTSPSPSPSEPAPSPFPSPSPADSPSTAADSPEPSPLTGTPSPSDPVSAAPSPAPEEPPSSPGV